MSWIHRLFAKKPPFDTAFADCTTPRDVCAVVRRWIRPVAENGTDRWLLPSQTWRQGFGDCEDIAHLVEYACTARNIKAYTMIYWGPRTAGGRWNGHMIAVGEGWFADNGQYCLAAEATRDQIILDRYGMRRNA
jgi:transglutaminase-like putative cysteine protease